MNERPTHAWCPACAEEVAIDRSSRCLWCDAETTESPVTPKRRGGWKRPDKVARVTEAQLRALHLVHVQQGLSIRELGRRIWERVGYASEKSAANSISAGWKRLGLRARPKSEATALANVQRRTPGSPGVSDRAAHKRWARERNGGQRRCAGEKLTYPGKGRPCERWAMLGSDFCLQHDPERRAEVVERVERTRAAA